MSNDLRFKTCGLCGTFDGNKNNDFTAIEGEVVSSALDFARSWKMNTAEGKHFNFFFRITTNLIFLHIDMAAHYANN